LSKGLFEAPKYQIYKGSLTAAESELFGRRVNRWGWLRYSHWMATLVEDFGFCYHGVVDGFFQDIK
jgi:hypothetical protein